MLFIGVNPAPESNIYVLSSKNANEKFEKGWVSENDGPPVLDPPVMDAVSSTATFVGADFR
jgi:hypothetical protein